MTKPKDCPRACYAGGWRQVVFAADCDPDTELCPCGRDYATECVCPGPTEDGIEYRGIGGVLCGRPIAQPDSSP